MTVINGRRGQFIIENLDTAEGQGVQVSLGGMGSPVGGSSLVTSFGVTQSENFSVSQCLNGGTFLYTFGHDPQQSRFSLGVTTFLDRTCNSDADDLRAAMGLYAAGRVSASRAISTLTVGASTIRGYLIGQEIRVASNELGMVATNYAFIALRPQLEEEK